MLINRFILFFAIALPVFLALPLSAAEEVRIKNSGMTLNARLTLANGKTLKDGVVLMVHGTLAHNEMDTIRNLNAVLVERGMNTLAINLSLGIDDRHGPYDCAVTHRHRHDDAIAEITAWMAWLHGRGSGPVVLFGHSRGGNQTAQYAANKPDPLLKRLVLMAPATWDRGRAAKNFEKRQKMPLAGALTKARSLVKSGRGDDVMSSAGLLYCTDADATANSFLGYYEPDLRFDTPTVLKQIAVPTLVVAAGKDTVIRGLPEMVKPQADGKRLHFAVVDDAGHFFLDLYAEDVADLMEEFLGIGS